MINNDHFRTLIRNKIELLENSADRTDVDLRRVELDQTRVGRLSRMDAMQMQQMELELDRRQAREMAALRAALERLDQNEFGFCGNCGDEINPKRLEIDLAATLCIDCANAKESGS